MIGPKFQEGYVDRDLDCQEEMAAKIIDALDEAEIAGWDRFEAAKAMLQAAHSIYIGQSGTDPNE